MIQMLVVAALLGLAGYIAYLRFTPADPDEWHVDPRAMPKPRVPNHWMIRPIGGDATAPDYPPDAVQLAALVDRIALAWPDTVRFAGSVEGGHLTYLARSPWLGMPEFISVRTFRTPGGSSLAAFARSRFRSNDHGTSRARLDRLMAEVDAAVRALPDA